MAEQPAGDKTLPASPRKLQMARERGNVARSGDLTSGALLLAAGIALSALGPAAFQRLLAITGHYFGELDPHPLTRGDVQPMALKAMLLMAPAALPLMLVLMGVGVLMNVTQFGIVFSGQALQPKFERLNPLKGFQRLFSLRALVELLKSIVKFAAIAAVVWAGVRHRLPELFGMMQAGAWGAAVGTWELVWAVWWRIGLTMLTIGILDFVFQRWQYLQDQRMTRQEAIEEMRQLEGDPRIRQRVRQIQRQMAMRRMMVDVPTADVVITNPTTYAIALRYAPERMQAPRVVAKGMRLVAERIREVASNNEVPIIERPDLARALFRDVEIGAFVPEELFRAVAEVLAYVYQIDRRAEKVAERRKTA
jgi:flagellar biosynthetic protein FlhB